MEMRGSLHREKKSAYLFISMDPSNQWSNQNKESIPSLIETSMLVRKATLHLSRPFQKKELVLGVACKREIVPPLGT